MSNLSRPKLKQSGMAGECVVGQVHIADQEDLEYWRKETADKGYQFLFDCHIPVEYYLNRHGIEYDIYTIVPINSG